jgi:hypothetical protein
MKTAAIPFSIISLLANCVIYCSYLSDDSGKSIAGIELSDPDCSFMSIDLLNDFGSASFDLNSADLINESSKIDLGNSIIKDKFESTKNEIFNLPIVLRIAEGQVVGLNEEKPGRIKNIAKSFKKSVKRLTGSNIR